MQVTSGLEAIDPPLSDCVLAIGNFDGVHLAHRQLLRRARELVGDAAGPVVVLTFEPHPLAIVDPRKVPPRLSTPEDKLRRLEEAGVDRTVVARSDPALLQLPAEDFVERVVCRLFHPAHIVEGASFGFGRGRKGTPQLLQRLAASWGCTVHILEPITVLFDGGTAHVVSSSLIRRLLIDGQVECAARCLGRPYSLLGQVVVGDGRGRTIGFPTANLATIDQLVPADGVYAGAAGVSGRKFLAAISIGRHPTFGGRERCVEAHLLDFDGDLYGRELRLDFQRLLRGQRAFDGPARLAEQLRRDVAAVRAGATVVETVHGSERSDPP